MLGGLVPELLGANSLLQPAGTTEVVDSQINLEIANGAVNAARLELLGQVPSDSRSHPVGHAVRPYPNWFAVIDSARSQTSVHYVAPSRCYTIAYLTVAESPTSALVVAAMEEV